MAPHISLERFLRSAQYMQSEQRNRKGSSHAGLQIKEDFAFARTEWKIQRGGWLLLGLLTLAAVLGLFGTGILSSASVAGGGLDLQYERFERFQRPTKIQLRLRAEREQAVTVFLNRAYVDAIKLERITPQPEKAEASAQGLLYHFAVNSDPITVTFHFQLEQVGRVEGQIGRGDGPMISFNQFVYP